MDRNLKIEEKIKNQFKTYKGKYVERVTRFFFIRNPECKEYCEKILKEIPEWCHIKYIAINKITRNEELKKCEECRKIY